MAPQESGTIVTYCLINTVNEERKQFVLYGFHSKKSRNKYVHDQGICGHKGDWAKAKLKDGKLECDDPTPCGKYGSFCAGKFNGWTMHDHHFLCV